MRSPEMALRSTRNTVELNALALGTGNTEKCQRAARKGRGKQGRRRDGHRLRSSFLCRWPPLSPPPSWADSRCFACGVCVCVCVGPVPVYLVSSV